MVETPYLDLRFVAECRTRRRAGFKQHRGWIFVKEESLRRHLCCQGSHRYLGRPKQVAVPGWSLAADSAGQSNFFSTM